MKVKVLASDAPYIYLETTGTTGKPAMGPLRMALKQTFDCEIEGPSRNQYTGCRPIVFVVPNGERMWLKDLLSNLEMPQTKPCYESAVPFYIILRVSDELRDNTYVGLAHQLEKWSFAATVDLTKKGINILNEIFEQTKNAFAQRNRLLRDVLDEALPGGIEGLFEIALRPTGHLHNEITYRPSGNDWMGEAFSLAFGANMAGDLNSAHLRIIVDSAIPFEKQRSSEKMNSLLEHAEKAGVLRASLGVPKCCLSPLSDYMRRRRVLLVEDRLEQDGWNHVMPALLGAPPENSMVSALQSRTLDQQEIAGAKWTWCEKIDDLLPTSFDTKSDEYRGKKASLAKIDILFLDLSSSSENHPDGVISPMLKSEFVRLAALLQDIRKDCDPELNLVSGAFLPKLSGSIPKFRKPYPIVIAFTATQTGMTTRTMLQEIGISDFFFKAPQGRMHQRLHYYTFRNVIVTALENRAAWITYSDPAEFKRWISQFDRCDQPDVLRIMEQYRHYSVNSMIQIWYEALETSLFDMPCDECWITYLGRPNKSGAATLSVVAKALNLLQRDFRVIEKSETLPKIKMMTYEDLVDRLPILSRDGSAGNARLRIVFVDDFIASSGQLKSYLNKFIDKLPKEERFLHLVSFEAWYAVGLATEGLRDFLQIQQGDEPLSKKTYSIDMNPDGRVIIVPYYEHRLMLDVRIEDVSLPLSFNENNLERILNSRTLITRGRRYEVPCQFEPFGWKEGLGLLSTFSNVPGNTIPVIWADGFLNGWLPLKQRFFNPISDGEIEKSPPCLAPGGLCPLDPGNEVIKSESKAPKRDESESHREYLRRIHPTLGCQVKERRF